MATTLAPVIQHIFRDSPPSKPTVQLIDVKPVQNSSGDAPTRVKVQISDGEQYGLAVLTGESAKLLMSETVKLHSLIVLKNYVVNQLGTTKMCIVLEMSAVPSEDAEMAKIGEPVKWDTVEVASPGAKKELPSNSPATGQGTSRTAPSNFEAGRPSAVSGRPPAAPQNYNPTASSPLSSTRATPIEALNPYSSKWIIKVRVVSKGELRQFSNDRGASSVFSFDVCDESGEIRINAWKEIADRLFGMIEAGKTYLISRGQIKMANKKFSSLNNNYEITLGFETQLQEVAAAEQVKATIHYNFVPIGDIASRPANATVDVMGVVTDVSAASSITSSKSGKELTKRTMKVADDSGSAIELTLWGQNATDFPDDLGEASVVAFKGMRVTEWNQRSLGASNGSLYEINPALEAAERLKSWWEGGGGSSVVSLSQDTRGAGAGSAKNPDERTTTMDLFERGERATSDPEYGSFRGVLSKHLLSDRQGGEDKPMWYSSCPKCNKKVIGDEASGHSCENCGWSGAECSYRYILPLVLLDGDGSIIATAFNEQGIALLGKKADELKRIKDANKAEFEAIVASAMWKPSLFRLRAKMETYNDTSRVKAAILTAAPINYANEGKLLLKDIAKYNLPEADLEAAAVATGVTLPSPSLKVKTEVKTEVKAEVKAEPAPEPMQYDESADTGASQFSQFDD